MSSNKRKSIDLETKYKVLKELDKKVSYEEIATKFGITANNITKIKGKRNDIIAAYEGSTSVSVKKIRTGKYPELDKALLQFINKCNLSGVAINTILLQEKARQLCEELHINDLKCSIGYIQKFCKRNSVVFEQIHGESGGVSVEICNEWISKKLPQILNEYKQNDIFNADEFGLFWRLFPSKTYKVKGNTFKSAKKSKERVSVLVGANMSGTEKLKLLVIGRSMEPRCFRNKKALPVVYHNSEKSWMNGDLFIEFLKKLNYKMKKNNRKIALIIDNCSVHPMMSLSNVRIIYLPPNTTSALQPMDMGVIHSIKSKYRVKIARKLLALLEIKETIEPKDIDLYEAILMLKESWDEVSSTTIKNCFTKSGFTINEQQIENESEELTEFGDWNELSDRLAINLSFDEYVTADDDVMTSPDETNITETAEADMTNISDSGSDTETYDMEETESPMKLIHAMNAITALRKYMYQSCDNIEGPLEMVKNIETFIFSHPKSLRQSQITDYFRNN